MISSDQLFDQPANDLVSKLLDGELDTEELCDLGEQLRSNPQVRQLYHDHIALHAMLRWMDGAPQRDEFDEPPAVEPMALDAECSTTSSSLPLPLLRFPSSNHHNSFTFLSSGWPVAYLIATVIFAVGALVGSSILVSQPTQVAQDSHPVSNDRVAAVQSDHQVGLITGMVGCVFEKKRLGIGDWELEEGSKSKVQGSRSKQLQSRNSQITKSVVSLGDTFHLASGLMEITYNTGAKVILQGPVTYEVNSNDGGYLSAGRLTARVEKKAEEVTSGREPVAGGQWLVASDKQSTSDIHHSVSAPSPLASRPSSLFIIATPTAVITDLGTEFGVEVNEYGNTVSHVFRGSVKVQRVGEQGASIGDGQVLRENETVRVERRGSQSEFVTLDASTPSHFIRGLPEPAGKKDIKTFDLVDVVAGGDGFSGRRNAGIDPTTGRMSDQQPPLDKDLKFASDGKYHRVQGSPFIDGVFIPGGGSGSVQTDSAGHAFGDFFATANSTSGYIWAGGTIPSPTDYPVQIRTELGGIDYSSPGHGLLFLQSNQALSFDLDAIRRANPGYRLSRFRAAVGNTETVSERGIEAYGDVWVLMDGERRFNRRQINAFSGAYSVSVEIGPKDRFLTLAATDGGNGIGNDWILFGDPVMELKPVMEK